MGDGAEPAVQARDVARAFGDVQAVAAASLEVRRGTVTALIGPNGCGKTTLMLMLAGLLRPDSGEIRVEGADPRTDAAAVRDAIGWMPDQLGTWDNVTCAQTLALVGRAYGLARAQARERAATLLDLVHLGEFADRPARVLSRGQKQRLSLARALVNDPAVVLLDEPANGLDPRSRVELRHLVRDLAAHGRAVLISSHVLSELDEMVDDAVFMSKGRTLGDEVAQEVARARARYRIGSMDDAALAADLRAARVEVDDRDGLVVSLSGEEEAAAALAWMIGQGHRIHRFAPAGSALEQTYMAMEEERR
ncbi:ABC transporter ATP-binding protein [Demequina pelophila]|uniref:ABC transporter ATP-binding protein n=1 Tax=Demequina pelophila TaxID=1638984 RepID=UPI000784CE46|nr:ABC transporter ATP-binding protein [Demequina pelophila]